MFTNKQAQNCITIPWIFPMFSHTCLTFSSKLLKKKFITWGKGKTRCYFSICRKVVLSMFSFNSNRLCIHLIVTWLYNIIRCITTLISTTINKCEVKFSTVFGISPHVRSSTLKTLSWKLKTRRKKKKEGIFQCQKYFGSLCVALIPTDF